MNEVPSNALKSADRSVCVSKRINTTRCSCRADASKAFVQGYPEIKNALAEFADNPNEVPKVRSESKSLYERMCLLETGIYSVFWNDILERVNATSRKLHDPKLDLNAAVATVERLMHNRLYNFLAEHNILSMNQFGFRKNYSTFLALMDLVDNIKKH